ncbi:MAG: hypothetical protein HQL39_14390 [Alphaproteobacteria bacterium]|nr:hypothetical protein [Alphaproteobacteria bacterium]
MKRPDLEHVLRAAAAITGEAEFVVVGSTAILAQFPNAPAGLVMSQEADLYPVSHPELGDLIEGTIGRDSPFHGTFGYYADAVGPETAKLPRDWRSRAIRLAGPATGGATAWCPEVHDLAAAKLVAGREKDVDWVRGAVAAGLVAPARLIGLLDDVQAEPALIEAARRRASTLG